MTDYADLQKRLRDPGYYPTGEENREAADAIAALVAKYADLRVAKTKMREDLFVELRKRSAENAALQAKLERVRQWCAENDLPDTRAVLEGSDNDRICEVAADDHAIVDVIDDLLAILDEPNDVAGAGASVSISADARVSHLSPAEAAIKPGPQSCAAHSYEKEFATCRSGVSWVQHGTGACRCKCTCEPAPEARCTKGRFYPDMPPALPGESDDEYTNRLTGADGTNRVPYDHRRNRQCSIGYHDECTDPQGKTCKCPCHPTDETAAVALRAFLSSLFEQLNDAPPERTLDEGRLIAMKAALSAALAQRAPVTVTNEMVEAMRPFIAELEDAWDQWKDGNVKAVLHKMLTAALAVRGETK